MRILLVEDDELLADGLARVLRGTCASPATPWTSLLTVRAPAGVRVEYDAAGAAAGWELVCEEA